MRDLSVVQPRTDVGGVLSFELGQDARLTRGLDFLVQMVLIELHSEPLPFGGGSGFVQAMRETFIEKDEIGRRRLNVAFGIAKANIRRYQNLDPLLEPDDRLRDMRILRTVKAQLGWEVDILIESEAGTTKNITVNPS